MRIFLNFFLIDPIRKILALIFAFGLWFFVAIDTNYLYTKNVIINYTGLPESYVLVDSLSQIRVTFSGRGRALFNIWASPLRAICSLEDVRVGENDILTKDLNLPVGDVNFTYEKKSFSVMVDEKLKKVVKVKVPIRGQLKEGYSISGIFVFDTVIATGPKGILKDISEICSESLDIKNQFTTFEKEIKIYPPPHIQLSTYVIRIKIEIDTTMERVFTGLPIKLLDSRKRQVSPRVFSLDTLLLAGARQRVAALKEDDISIRINISSLKSGEHSLPAEIILPEYITPVYSIPRRFRIKIY